MVESEDILATVRVNVTNLTKGQRTQVHVAIRNGYPSLQSETKDEGALNKAENNGLYF